ncbi:hypothetical protein APHAL10511_008359 [Amanita phalloides]|nr:hypothetical protein APHAL10511_008359 [Amanita phalloides]
MAEQHTSHHKQRREEQCAEHNYSPLKGELSCQGSRHPRRSPSPHDEYNMAAVLTQLVPDWAIHQETHLPYHLKQCADCVRFSKHVIKTNQGGAFAIFLDKQFRHWHRALHEEMREELDVAYDDGLKKNEKQISKLEEELEKYHQRVSQLSQEKEVLKIKVNELSQLLRSGSSSGLAYAGREGAHQSEHRGKRKRESSSPRAHHFFVPHHQTSLRPFIQIEEEGPVHEPPPTLMDHPSSMISFPLTKGKAKRMMCETNSDFDSECEGNITAPSQSDNKEELEKALRDSRHEFTRESHWVEGEDQSSSSRMIIDKTPLTLRIGSALSQAKRFEPSAGSRRMRAGQFSPGYLSPHLEDPAFFRLNKTCKLHKLGVFRHICLCDNSYWDGDISFLWIKRASGGSWFWTNRKPMQLAREASQIPYNQRSYAQCWAVRDMMQTGLLPLNNASAEPDVEEIARSRGFPSSVHIGTDGCYNVQDITAWMFLTMTQPHLSKGTTAWFWWMACHIFERLGLFSSTLSHLGFKDKGGIGYMPT